MVIGGRHVPQAATGRVALSGQTVASGALIGDSDSPDNTGCVYTFGNVLGGQYEQIWTYGETGNHTAVTLDGAALSFAHDEAAADKGGLANEITEVNASGANIAHDAAGNMTKVPTANGGAVTGHRACKYDAWGRLVEVKNDQGDVISTMKYDGLGRRISKVITNSGAQNATYKFFYDGQQVIETHNGSNQVIKQKVWGPTYVDEAVQIGVNDNPGADNTVDTFSLVLDDANFNIVGIMNDSHDLIERREYHPYGRRQIFKQRGAGDDLCTSETPHPPVVVLGTTPQAYSLCDEGHQGLMHDKEFDMINIRARYLAPTICRFIGRDPLEYIDGNNLFAYLMDNPGNGLDPWGTAWYDGWETPVNFVTFGSFGWNLINASPAAAENGARGMKNMVADPPKNDGSIARKSSSASVVGRRVGSRNGIGEVRDKLFENVDAEHKLQYGLNALNFFTDMIGDVIGDITEHGSRVRGGIDKLGPIPSRPQPPVRPRIKIHKSRAPSPVEVRTWFRNWAQGQVVEQTDYDFRVTKTTGGIMAMIAAGYVARDALGAVKQRWRSWRAGRTQTTPSLTLEENARKSAVDVANARKITANDGFRLGKHGDMPSPRTAGTQSHHGAMSAWMNGWRGQRLTLSTRLKNTWRFLQCEWLSISCSCRYIVAECDQRRSPNDDYGPTS